MIACFSFGDIEGAKIRDSSRREKTFVNYSKAATSSNRQKPYYWDIVQVRSFCNVEMMALTSLLCAISIAPYIYFNLFANNLNMGTTLAWVFPPVLRATGGLITATHIQLLIQ